MGKAAIRDSMTKDVKQNGYLRQKKNQVINLLLNQQKIFTLNIQLKSQNDAFNSNVCQYDLIKLNLIPSPTPPLWINICIFSSIFHAETLEVSNLPWISSAQILHITDTDNVPHKCQIWEYYPLLFRDKEERGEYFDESVFSEPTVNVMCCNCPDSIIFLRDTVCLSFHMEVGMNKWSQLCIWLRIV